ncbi:MBL fold metallo-hydrolase RNA specificity domain-containing protein [Botrimarina hoheduenensis]|uniref:Ribonuclease n=1 Tax=Botrimarina hoheduenensis TaxID=2528000 RepID=A0A5C5W8E5_9BACT|nr:MBL fold metallo-hydrolase [Botrimarina hoheduenensis]TWT46727.1 Ribonuclease [Botrimarina hoheduenensis]
MHLSFHGAAGTVTGSKYLLETSDARVLVDCGLFQGLKSLRELNWAGTPFKVGKIDAVLLTHAHLDHVGYLPRIVKEGYQGPIYCTPATAELAQIILLDSAKIQEADAEYANKKGFSKHKPALPLYRGPDVLETLKLFKPISRGKSYTVAPGIEAEWQDAGHLLGSTAITVTAEGKRVLFSGDLGRYDGPLYHDPAPPPPCDYLICESTYGNRDHPDKDLTEGLAEVIQRGIARGGVMLMASFAVGRAQQLIYLLQVLKCAGRIPDLPIYLDSPMSVDATKIYRQHCEEHDLVEAELCGTSGCEIGDRPVLAGPAVHLCRSADESKALNHIEGPAIILSSSGMMTAGRIVHHLKRRLPDKRTTVILGGYMAVGTRGRDLKEGAKSIRMHGQEIAVNAAIEEVPGLSGHADRSGLLRWLGHLKQAPKQTFLTHGEPDSAAALADTLRSERGWDVTVPAMNDRVELA